MLSITRKTTTSKTKEHKINRVIETAQQHCKYLHMMPASFFSLLFCNVIKAKKGVAAEGSVEFAFDLVFALQDGFTCHMQSKVMALS